VSLQDLDLGDDAPEGKSLRLGTVTGVSGSDVIVELGPHSSGAISIDEFDGEPPPVGSKLRVSVRGEEDGLLLLSIREAKALAAWDALEEGSHVKVTFSGVNRGGLEGKIGQLTAFMPASQAALHRIDDLSELAGKTLVCAVAEINRERKRVVVSRRAVLEAEAQEAREHGLSQIVPGAVVRAKVVRMESFGAFCEIGHGLEGLLHVSNMSYARVGHPSEAVRIGQELELKILEISEGGRRIGLGLKQLQPDPWDEVAARYPVDTVFTGKVRRLTDFGAFIELVPGVEGLLHVSQLGGGHVRHAKEVLKPGQQLTVRVTKMDVPAHRVSLSRLDTRGGMLDGESAADAGMISEVLQKTQESSIGTNLGALFKKALKKDG
jgi:4-hydroxy-3-methylbut-2-enyl diphosphate reductase